MANKVNLLYESAWHFSKQHDRELDLDDKVYENLLSILCDNFKNNPLFSFDVISSCADRFLVEDSMKDKLEKNRGENLISYIEEILKLNKQTYYLLIPINGARLSFDIHFNSFYFIAGTQEEKENKIHQITKVGKNKIRSFIEHTQKSRSKDFMESPMLIYRIDNLYENVYKNASLTSQKIFQIIKLMVYKLETEEDFYEQASSWCEDNYHVGIIGKEDWQQGHGNWWNLIRCRYSLDFLTNHNNQKDFINLVNTFVTEQRSDELYYKFSNALELFEKSLEQYENFRDSTLSIMLIFSATESLITEGYNEKSLRLSVIWPRLVNITNKTQKELSVLIRDTYLKRNDFVHSGYLLTNSEKSHLRVLHQMLAKLIYMYLSHNKWDDMNCENEEKSITKWKKYINKIFENAVYSE